MQAYDLLASLVEYLSCLFSCVFFFHAQSDIFDKLKFTDNSCRVYNSDTTLRAVLHHSGKNFTKKGGLSAKGTATLAGKKPLIGASRDLSRQIAPHYSQDSVTITASPIYAAIQQFGGKKSQFPHLWGDIPARPFLPVTQAGNLYPDEERDIVAVVNEALMRAIG